MIGQILSERYRLVDELHRSALSIIFRAEDLTSHRTVVVKMLAPEHARASIFTKRFQQYAEVNSYLNHPNICAISDYGIVSVGQPYVVLDYIEGPTLEAVISSEGSLHISRFCEIFSALCDAMEHAHSNEKCVVHRDLKPSNFIISKKDGQVHPVIIDFYLAKAMRETTDAKMNLTQTGEVLGTPLYMSPEQCMGGEVDQSTDIYSMGCVMFYALTGRAPFVGTSAIETMQMKIEREPAHEQLPEVFKSVVLKAMNRELKNRYRSMAELKSAIAL